MTNNPAWYITVFFICLISFLKRNWNTREPQPTMLSWFASNLSAQLSVSLHSIETNWKNCDFEREQMQGEKRTIIENLLESAGIYGNLRSTAASKCVFFGCLEKKRKWKKIGCHQTSISSNWIKWLHSHGERVQFIIQRSSYFFDFCFSVSILFHKSIPSEK